VISVLLVDDHPFIRMGFRMVLDAEDDLEVIGEAADGSTAVSMCSALRPDVVNIQVPGFGVAAGNRGLRSSVGRGVAVVGERGFPG
jgi:DNA-binding NarL/FixJ family response regulator